MNGDDFFDYVEKAPKFSREKALSFKKGKVKKKYNNEGLRF